MLVTSTSPLHQQSGISRARKNGLVYGLKSPGCRRIAADYGRTSKRGKVFVGNDLQTLLDFCGSPQIDTVERVKGIEPSYAAWEAAVLPLNYTRFGKIRASQLASGRDSSTNRPHWLRANAAPGIRPSLTRPFTPAAYPTRIAPPTPDPTRPTVDTGWDMVNSGQFFKGFLTRP